MHPQTYNEPPKYALVLSFIRVPLSFLAQLIQQSYDPISSHQLSPDDQRRLQSELFELQRRWEAWGLVMPFLFEYSDPNVQFFGAHTAQVKISRDWCATQSTPRLLLRF